MLRGRALLHEEEKPMAYGHSVCALAARAGLEPAAAGECHPQALPLSYRAVSRMDFSMELTSSSIR